MARKNNPKQTVENIISVSAKLFSEKGYEQTTMQDIVDTLGMSKGAIFHHFKSKEEIFNKVIEVQAEFQETTMRKWIEEMQEMNAKEKLTALLEKNLSSYDMHTLDNALATQIENPRFVVSNMMDLVSRGAPIIASIMRQGVQDGSVITDFPDECAEVFLLLFNIWCDPVLFRCDMARLTKRFHFLQQMMRMMCADILNEELIEKYVNFIERLYGGKN